LLSLRYKHRDHRLIRYGFKSLKDKLASLEATAWVYNNYSSVANNDGRIGKRMLYFFYGTFFVIRADDYINAFGYLAEITFDCVCHDE